jgi:hypothetical protein
MIYKRYKEMAKIWAFPIFKYIYKPLVRRRRFRVEKELWKGAPFEACDRPSILFFTTYKCASSFIGQLLNDLSAGSGYRRANFDSLLTEMEVDVHAVYRDPAFLANAFRQQGFIYGPMRHFQAIPNMDQYKILLLLRDPRDVLVSHYYSVLFSHSIISKKLLEKRRANVGKDIDKFVLDHLDEFAKIYERYCDNLLGLENVTFYSYENMISEPRAFLIFLREYLDVVVEDSELDAIAENRMKLPKTENKYSNFRSGRSGQFAEKLKSETLRKMEQRLARVLTAFGYR